MGLKTVSSEPDSPRKSKMVNHGGVPRFRIPVKYIHEVSQSSSIVVAVSCTDELSSTLTQAIRAPICRGIGFCVISQWNMSWRHQWSRFEELNWLQKQPTLAVTDGSKGPKFPQTRLTTPDLTIGDISINSSSAWNSDFWKASSPHWTFVDATSIFSRLDVASKIRLQFLV